MGNTKPQADLNRPAMRFSWSD